jgi:DNA repair exonuclease SbcCD nuclease subunit
MIRLDIMSDLHVDYHYLNDASLEQFGISKDEYQRPPLFNFQKYHNVGSNILLIAGDVSDNIDEVEEVLMDASKIYEHIVYVDGNHEHKGADSTDVSTNMDRLAMICNGLTGVHYFDGIHQLRWDYNGTAFIGANGWYCWKGFEDKGIPFTRAFCRWDDQMPDNTIDFSEYGYPNTLGFVQAVNLASEMDKISRDDSIHSVVVVTHTCPVPSLLRWSTDFAYNEMSASFTNTALEQVFSCDHGKKIKLWAYGHTHDRKCTQRDQTTLINNSYGYPRDVMSSAWSMVNVEVI